MEWMIGEEVLILLYEVHSPKKLWARSFYTGCYQNYRRGQSDVELRSVDLYDNARLIIRARDSGLWHLNC
jgi:hypothetical protein